MITGDVDAIAVRRAKSLELRVAGASYSQIAREQGVSKDTAWSDVQAELTDLREITKKLAEELRELELRRLDAWTVLATKQARGSFGKAGDVRAIFALAKLQERRAKLLGLDAPTKIAPTNPDGTEAYAPVMAKLEALSEEELIALRAIAAKAQGQTT